VLSLLGIATAVVEMCLVRLNFLIKTGFLSYTFVIIPDFVWDCFMNYYTHLWILVVARGKCDGVIILSIYEKQSRLTTRPGWELCYVEVWENITFLVVFVSRFGSAPVSFHGPGRAGLFVGPAPALPTASTVARHCTICPGIGGASEPGQ